MNESNNKYIKKEYIYVLLYFIITNLIVFYKLFFTPGLIFHGDETYFKYPYSFSLKYLITTYHLGGVPPWGLFTYEVPLFILIKLLGLPSEIAYRIFFIAMLALAGLIVYYGFKLILRVFGIYRSWSVFLAANLYYFSPFNPLLKGFLTSEGFGYSELPFIVGTLFAFIFERRILSLKYILLLSFVVLFFTAQPNTIYSFMIISIILLIYIVIKEKELLKYAIFNILLIFVIIIFSLSYVLIPTFAGYFLLQKEGFFKYYSTEHLTFQDLKFLSHHTLPEILFYGNYPYFFFLAHPNTIFPFNIILLIFAIIPLLLINKIKAEDVIKSRILLIFILLLLFVFISKGVNPPFEEIYYHVAKTLPDGLGTYLRNPDKFLPFYVLSLSTLITISYSFIRNHIMKASIFIVPILITFYLLIYHLSYYTYIDYSPTKIPEAWIEVYNYLQNESGRVLVFPDGGLFIWKRGNIGNTLYDIVTGFPCGFLPLECYSYYTIKSSLNVSLIPYLFNYVLLHTDNPTYYEDSNSREEILQILNKHNYTLIYELYNNMEKNYTILDVRFTIGFSKDLLLSVENLRLNILYKFIDKWTEDAVKYRVFETFCENKKIYVLDEGKYKIYNGTCSFYIPTSILYDKTTYLYIDAYCCGFKNVTPVFYIGTSLYGREIQVSNITSDNANVTFIINNVSSKESFTIKVFYKEIPIIINCKNTSFSVYDYKMIRKELDRYEFLINASKFYDNCRTSNITIVLPIPYSPNLDIEGNLRVSNITNYNGLLGIVSNSLQNETLSIKVTYKLSHFVIFGLSITFLYFIILVLLWIKRS